MKRFLAAVVLIMAGAVAAAEPGPTKARDDVAYWTTTYTGEEMKSGKFDCQPPAIPAVSRTNAEIDAVAKAVAAWEACYNGFADNLNDAMPPGKRIPAEVRARMTPAELEHARAHLDQVYGELGARAQESAVGVLAKRDAWRAETDKYVAEQNRQNVARNEARKRELEADLRRLDELRANSAGTPVGPAPAAGK